MDCRTDCGLTVTQPTSLIAALTTAPTAALTLAKACMLSLYMFSVCVYTSLCLTKHQTLLIQTLRLPRFLLLCLCMHVRPQVCRCVPDLLEMHVTVLLWDMSKVVYKMCPPFMCGCVCVRMRLHVCVWQLQVGVGWLVGWLVRWLVRWLVG